MKRNSLDDPKSDTRAPNEYEIDSYTWHQHLGKRGQSGCESEPEERLGIVEKRKTAARRQGEKRPNVYIVACRPGLEATYIACTVHDIFRHFWPYETESLTKIVETLLLLGWTPLQCTKPVECSRE